MFEYACMYLASKALSCIMKVIHSPYDLFSAVKEEASEECMTPALSIRKMGGKLTGRAWLGSRLHLRRL